MWCLLEAVHAHHGLLRPSYRDMPQCTCSNQPLLCLPHYSITQKPSWVWPPSSYTPSSISSLSVAFEDPDDSKLKQVLAEHYLYIFRHRVLVKKWKYWHPKNKDNSKSNATKHNQDNKENHEEDIEINMTLATMLRSSGLKVQRAQVTLRRVE